MDRGGNKATPTETVPAATEPTEATDGATEPPLNFEDREVVVRADFDAVDDDGCLWVSLRFLRGPRHPRAGETVYLLGTEGRACMGEVTDVNGWMARVRPDSAPGD